MLSGLYKFTRAHPSMTPMNGCSSFNPGTLAMDGSNPLLSRERSGIVCALDGMLRAKRPSRQRCSWDIAMRGSIGFDDQTR